MDILPKDLYTDPLVEYEPSILFLPIRDDFLEISFSLEVPKTYIYSFHLTAYKVSFILISLVPALAHLKTR